MNTNYFAEDYIPGTTNIFSSSDDSSSNHTGRPLKKNKDGVILLPQPSDSPNDPLNWSAWRKTWHFLVVCFITGLTAAISNDAGAAQDSLNQFYGISYDAMNTGAGVLFLFIGWSCIFFAPASSLYGRRITYLICLLAGTLGSVWFAVSKRTADTIWSQAFVGMSEACAEAQAQQSLADIFFQHQLGSVLTVYIMATSVGSFLGPLIAHLISESQTFRWVGWWGAIITGGTLIVTFFTCEETVFDRQKYFPVYESPEEQIAIIDDPTREKMSLKEKDDGENLTTTVVSRADGAVETTRRKSRPEQNNIMKDEEAGVEKEKPNPYWKRISLITPSEYMVGYGFKQYVERFIIYFKVFTLPAVWLSGILWGLQDAYMTFFLTTQDTFFYDAPWNLSETGVAVMNVATLVGAVIGCIMSGVISDKHVLWLAKRNNGVFEPEYRLYLLFSTMIISPVGLIMFGAWMGGLRRFGTHWFRVGFSW